MTEEQRRHLENRLLDERADRMRRLAAFREEEGSSSERDRAGDLSAVPQHPADLGTDTMQAELDATAATRGSRELEEIDAALARLYREPDRFGLDERTGQEIPFARLDVVPWARTAAEGGPAAH